MSPRSATLVALVVLPAGALVASVVATQYLAVRVDAAAAAVPTPFAGLHLPHRAIEWSIESFASSPDVVLHAWTWGAAAGLGTLALFAFLVLASGRRAPLEDGHGSSRWARRDDLVGAALLDRAASGTSLVVGGWRDPAARRPPTEYLVHDGPESTLVFGGSGSGKTASVIVPNLLHYESSAFVLDTKGELWRLTAGYRRDALGQAVLFHDPSSRDPGNAGFNPLAEIDVALPTAVREVQMLLEYLVPGGSEQSSNAQHFIESARSLGTGVFLCEMAQAALEERETTIPAVLSRITDAARPFKTYLRDVMRDFEGVTAATDRVVRETAAEMIAREDREFSSILSSLVTPLTRFRDPILAAAVSRSDFRIRDLVDGERPVTLYLVIRPSERDRLKHYFALVVNLLYRRLIDSTDPRELAARHPLWACLDEFTALPPLPVVQQSMDVQRSYGIKSTIVVQDIESLNRLYGASETFTSNSRVQVAYTPSKPKTAQYLSTMTGVGTVVERNRSAQRKRLAILPESTSRGETRHARALMTPDEVQRLGVPLLDEHARMVAPGEALVFVRGCYPVRAVQTPYFMDQEMLERARHPTPDASDIPGRDPDEAHDALPAALRGEPVRPGDRGDSALAVGGPG